MTPENIERMINAMSVEEMKTRLAAYMTADQQLAGPVAIEVRLKDEADSRCRYKVLLVMEDGEEIEVKFTDRPSRLLYIYTLMHPQGFQRRNLTKNNYQPLRELYSKLYFTSTDAVLKSIESLTFNQYFNQAVSQARSAIRKAISKSEDFVIACPQQNNGKTLVTFAANGGQVIIDNSLL